MKFNVKDFFSDNQVLLVGYSSKSPHFSHLVYRAFIKGGLKVYPFNTNKNSKYDIPVINDLKDIINKPSAACILLKPENTASIIPLIAEAGIKKILFQSSSDVTPQILEDCDKLGITYKLACPLMYYGGFIHKIHGFFAGA